MELAVHLRDVSQTKELGNISRHAKSLYDPASVNEEDWAKAPLPSLSRIYIGDEFCSHRLPLQSELYALYQFAQKEGLSVTLLIPVLTDAELERHSPVFDCLNDIDPRAEVVCNDWGSLCLLKELYPHFRLAAGRTLNKGFKDPRLLEPGHIASFSDETRALLRESTSDQAAFQEKLLHMGVSRLEKDLLPYGEHWSNGSEPKLNVSTYFPYGYITTGRVCLAASFTQPTEQKFTPPHRCARSCNGSAFELKGEASRFRIMLSGNTAFYLYDIDMIGSLLKTAGNGKVRLVYQGYAV